MALELLRGTSPSGVCSYLPHEVSSLEYRYLLEISAEEFGGMLARGWRRQGACFFRPRCPACVKCRSLRVLCPQFAPNKSQRRCLKQNADVRLVVRTPRLTSAHIALFNAYHEDMQTRRGWNFEPTTQTDYAQTFLAGHFEFATEFAYFRGRELIGVGLVDLTPHAMSSIYYYHHPGWRSLGPGVFSVLQEIAFGQRSGRQHLYLGYWIAQNASMSYKNRYEPHEVLASHVPDDESPVWQTADAIPEQP